MHVHKDSADKMFVQSDKPTETRICAKCGHDRFKIYFYDNHGESPERILCENCNARYKTEAEETVEFYRSKSADFAIQQLENSSLLTMIQNQLDKEREARKQIPDQSK